MSRNAQTLLLWSFSLSRNPCACISLGEGFSARIYCKALHLDQLWLLAGNRYSLSLAAHDTLSSVASWTFFHSSRPYWFVADGQPLKEQGFSFQCLPYLQQLNHLSCQSSLLFMINFALALLHVPNLRINWEMDFKKAGFIRGFICSLCLSLEQLAHGIWPSDRNIFPRDRRFFWFDCRSFS